MLALIYSETQRYGSDDILHSFLKAKQVKVQMNIKLLKQSKESRTNGHCAISTRDSHLIQTYATQNVTATKDRE